MCIEPQNFFSGYFVEINLSLLGQPKVNEVKFFLPCLEVMKRPQTKFQVDAMRGFKVIKSRKSQNSALGQKKI